MSSNNKDNRSAQTLISVIIPLYNKEKIVEKTIRSVLQQTYTNFELIIIDDGSTDNSPTIVKCIKDDRIKLLEQKNGGPSKARNTGIKTAKAHWIVFLDADDELTPNALQDFIRLSEENSDADIINCTSYIRNGEKLKRIGHKSTGFIKNPFKYWFYGGLMPGTGHSMFRTSLMKRNLYDERIRRYEDAEILFRILKESKMYNFNIPTFYVNTQYSFASTPRKDISEDFIGHISFCHRNFWEKLCLYKLYLGERDNYTKSDSKQYSNLRGRYDLLILCKIFNWLK